MTTVFGFHEVEDGERWAKAWKDGPGSRHEMFGQLGITARNFRDPRNPNLVGVLFEVPDLDRFHAFLSSDEGKKAMAEDGVKAQTLKALVEFTP